MLLYKMPCKVMSVLRSPWAWRLDKPCCSGDGNLSLWPAQLGAGASAQHARLAATNNLEALSGRSCQLTEAWWLTGKDDSSHPNRKFSSVCIPVSLSYPAHPSLCSVSSAMCSSFPSCLIFFLALFLPLALTRILCITPELRPPLVESSSGFTLLSCIWYKSHGRPQESTGD